MSLSACPGVRKLKTSKKGKYNKSPGVCPGGGGAMVTVKIADTDKQHIMARRERAP